MSYRSRHQRAGDLLEYLLSDGVTIAGVDENGKIVLEAPEDTWPPSEALRDAIKDLELELLEAVQREVARLIVDTRFKAWQEPYVTEESALEQVRTSWPKHAPLVAAIDAHELVPVAFAAAQELAEITGESRPAESVAALIRSGVPLSRKVAREFADHLAEHWKEQGHGGACAGGAFEELEKALLLPTWWSMARRVPEPAGP